MKLENGTETELSRSFPELKLPWLTSPSFLDEGLEMLLPKIDSSNRTLRSAGAGKVRSKILEMGECEKGSGHTGLL